MALDSLNPQWTDRAPPMRVLDPLGAESTEARLQDRLLRPIISNALTQRLRYLSYWAWLTDHLDSVSDADRAVYEKILLLGSLADDCPSTGTGTNGIVGDVGGAQAAIADPSVDTIDISAEAFTIESRDRARFTAYYSGVLYRLLLFENEWTLTPLGEELASAYGDSVSFEFNEVKRAVEETTLSRDLLEKVKDTGCLCRISKRERDVLINCFWYLVSPSSTFDGLAFDRQPHPDLLQLHSYLSTDLEREGEELIEATLDASTANTDVDYSEDLDRFFSTGRDAFVRSSLVLLLAIGDWVERRPTGEPDFSAIQDAREAWRLLVHTQHVSAAVQSLFTAVQGVIRELEPITPDELLSTLFADDQFDEVAGRALAGLTLDEQSGGDRPTLTGIRDAVYFGEAPAGTLEATLPDDGEAVTKTWDGVCRQLKAGETDENEGPFILSGRSERAYRTLLDTRLSSASSVEEYREIAAISAVLLARLSTRYSQYFSRESVAPFVTWFSTAHQDPGPITVWRLSEAYDSPAHQGPASVIDDWPTSRFAATTARFTHDWVLTQYFERLYEKISDAGGRSPQFLHYDVDEGLSFNHGIDSGSLYNNGSPNFPTLKWARIGDIFYELGLTEGNRLSDMDVTDAGRDLVEAFTVDGAQ